MINIDELKTCEWEDIEVGEVFGADGCFVVLIKTAENKAIVIGCDDPNYGLIWGDISGRQFQFAGHPNSRLLDGGCLISAPSFNYYKLPKPIQKMFVSNLDTLGLIE